MVLVMYSCITKSHIFSAVYSRLFLFPLDSVLSCSQSWWLTATRISSALVAPPSPSLAPPPSHPSVFPPGLMNLSQLHSYLHTCIQYTRFS